MPSAYQPVSDPFPAIDDLRAIADVLAGNREMFEVLVRRYNQRLYRVGLAYLRNHAQAEDAMQNTYLKAFLHLRDFGRRSSAATWLTRIMINECLMTLRRRKQEGVSLEMTPETHPTQARAAETDLTMKEKKRFLEQAIAELAPRFRRVFVLREIQQLSTAETAACLGLSAENVRVTLHRAHEQLKAKLLKNAASGELFSYPAQFCDPLTGRVMATLLAVGS